MHKHREPYYTPGAFVYVGNLALELAAIWDGVDAAECGGTSLNQIGRALAYNWSAAVTALALKNMAVLRALIAEASP